MASVIAIFVAFGVLADFLFNAVVVDLVFHSIFKEHWIIIYGPVYFAIAVTLSTHIPRSRWGRYTGLGVIAYVAGTILGHSVLAGHRATRSYTMARDRGYPGVLLRSSDWPQILFVTGGKVQHEIDSAERVPVAIDVVTDYGCIRSAVVSKVAGVDVQIDRDATWTWRIDRTAHTDENDGPGMEDHIFPWCRRVTPLKALENPPGFRPWEQQPQPSPSPEVLTYRVIDDMNPNSWGIYEEIHHFKRHGSVPACSRLWS